MCRKCALLLKTLLFVLYENRNTEEVIIPRGHTIIEADTYLNVVASNDDYHKLVLLAGHKDNAHFNSVFIQGGSRICEYLIPELNKRRMRTKVIEKKVSEPCSWQRLSPKTKLF